MPIISINLAKGRTREQKQQFVKTVKQEAVKTLNVKSL